MLYLCITLKTPLSLPLDPPPPHHILINSSQEMIKTAELHHDTLDSPLTFESTALPLNAISWFFFVLGCYITGKRKKNTQAGAAARYTTPLIPREGKLDVFRHLATNTGHKTCAAASSSTELISPPIRAAFVD